MARSESPDLINCDIMAEWMVGFETLAQLRNAPAISAMPFIFITGGDDQSTMRRGMDLGAARQRVRGRRSHALIRSAADR